MAKKGFNLKRAQTAIVNGNLSLTERCLGRVSVTLIEHSPGRPETQTQYKIHKYLIEIRYFCALAERAWEWKACVCFIMNNPRGRFTSAASHKPSYLRVDMSKRMNILKKERKCAFVLKMVLF